MEATLGYNINNKITFFPFFISKDLFSFFNIGFFSILEIFFSLISLSHPDNAFEVSVLVTPLHIVPEWYFLEFYMILKAIPNKNAGFMIMFSSIFYIFIQSEPKGINLISANPRFLIMFTLGGSTGVILGNAVVDVSLHDTYYIIAHFHFVLSLGAIIALFLGILFYQDILLLMGFEVLW